MSPDNISRRRVLQGIGAGAITLGVGSGTAGAAGSPDRHNVGTSSPAAERAARRAAESVHRILDWGGGEMTISGQFSDNAIDRLRSRPDVRYVEADGELHAIDAELDNSWGVDRVDAEVAHVNGETGGDDTDGEGGAHIAIIDTGIDDDHADLDDNIGAGKAFVECGSRICGGPPCSTSNCNHAWSDDNDHGTHVAGIADAEDNGEGVVGVSTAATLHAVKVLDCNGCGSFSDVAAGIKHVADRGWDVANMSLGGSKSSTVEDAVEYAYGLGVLLVAAAGNDGSCTDCVSYPAAEPEVIAVSATNKDDQLASFSSQGPEVELAAPGVDIYSSVIDGYDTFSGTSMASPHVAGTGAQLMDNGNTNTEARDRMNATAEDLGLSSNEQGNGLVDVEAALDLAELSVDSLSADEVETSNDNAEFDVSWSVSDPDENLDTVELVLQDTTAGAQDDTATISVSGDSASGTTRLVASGDEGSGHSYDVTATVTDADGNTASETVGTSETEATPAVDSLSLTEVEIGDSDAEFDADWSVSDTDGDLSSLDLVLTDTDDGETEDSKTVDISGDSASGTTRLVAAGEDGSGHTYEVTATVSDTDGTPNSATATATESESTSSAPTIDSLGLSEDNHGGSPHADFDASWSVSDGDDDLDTVDLTLYELDSDGNRVATEDSASVDVSGGSASGTTDLKARFDENSGHTYEVELDVTDANGNTASDMATEVEDGS